MNTDCYKLVARILAWMRFKRIDYRDLPKHGISLEFYDDMLDGRVDCVRKSREMKHFCDAIQVNLEYFETGTIPVDLRWQDRRRLEVYEVLEEFKVRNRQTVMFNVSRVAEFVDAEVVKLNGWLNSPDMRSYKYEPPVTLEDVADRCMMYERQGG